MNSMGFTLLSIKWMIRLIKKKEKKKKSQSLHFAEEKIENSYSKTKQV